MKGHAETVTRLPTGTANPVHRGRVGAAVLESRRRRSREILVPSVRQPAEDVALLLEDGADLNIQDANG